MTEQEFRDHKYVWHCKARKTEKCLKNNYYCRGTGCKGYEPKPGSYHDMFPIKSLIKGVK